MRIGIDVNGVLRDTIGKFEQTYEKFMIEKNEEMDNLMTLELSGDTFNEDSFEVIDEVKKLDFKYEKLSEITSLNLTNHYSFKDKEEYYNFMYEEFAMSIFGHAGSSEYSSFNYLNEIYTNLRDNHELIIVSDEIGKSKPATLFFLSKFGCLLEQIKFFNNVTENNIINELDILLTSNPILLLKKYDRTKVIKFDTVYNNTIETEYTIKSLSEFEDKLKEIL
jgi:hypothetical protein